MQYSLSVKAEEITNGTLLKRTKTTSLKNKKTMKSFTSILLATFSAFLLTYSLPASKPNLFFSSRFFGATILESSLSEGKYFDQDIDHTGQIDGTFQQLYYESVSEEEDANNLKFLFIGGESALSTGSVVMNFMIQLADHFLADKYALEHRYYGQSQPFGNVTVDSLKYLTIDQSLDDIRNFIEIINSYTPDVHNKWILFGGSYAGNLAAWARMMYPDLILGAVASSAPVQVELNFKGYLESVSKIIEEKDAECKTIVKEGMNMLIHTFKTKTGKEKLATKFKMCETPKNEFDKYSLTSFIVELFTDAVEYNTKVVNGDRLSLLCNDLKSRKGDNMEKLASLVVDHYAIGSDCFNYNYNSNQDLFKTEIYEYNFERQWYYQKCTELGYFQTTGSAEQPFAHSLPLLYYTKLCKDAFGKNEKIIREGVEKTNSKYRANDLTKIANLIMVYGSCDPWNNLGILSFETDKSKAILIEDGWHCQDMIMASENEEVKKSRVEIKNTVEHWCSD